MTLPLPRAAACALLLATLVLGPALAAPPPEPPGAKDHPLVSRFPGSTIAGYFRSDWDQTRFPLSAETDDDEKFRKAVVVEGTITRLWYLGPVGKTPLEVFRNYQQAFARAGLKTRFACDGNCGYLFYRWRFQEPRDTATWSKGDLMSTESNSRWSIEDMIDNEQGRFFYGTLTQGGREIHVSVYTSIAGYDEVHASGTVIEIAEPKAMQTGQVTVDANAIGKGLAAEGHVALYGVYFDTGKAVLKAESDAQLAEMGKLLAAQPKLQVYVVGHTDNQGVFDANLALSKARADAVRDALVNRYKVAAARITAQGVANLAPVASNADDAGRARNRRVELVVK